MTKRNFAGILFFLAIAGLFSCQKKVTLVEKEAPPRKEKPLPPLVTVQVASENVRETPNGFVLGKLPKGARLTVLGRVGNWIQFDSRRFKEAYIWAPSVGFPYINLYNPYFYFDSLKQAFKPPSYFQEIFSQTGQVRQERNGKYELFFKDIGLGSHEETVLEVVTESQQLVEHGVTLFIQKEQNRIYKVRVDFLRPIQGYKKALKKCGTPVTEPSEKNAGHLIWPPGNLLPKLAVDLERKEWNSNLFSSIWYILRP